MKKILITTFATLATLSSFAQNLDLNTEFEFDQKVALERLEKSWLNEDADNIQTANFVELVRTNVRYRQIVTGPDNSLVGKMLQTSSKHKDLSTKEKINVAIMEYYASKGLAVDTRDSFFRSPYSIRTM